MSKSVMGKKERQTIGWREWIGLPDFGVKKIKAKIDSGALTSSLHAFDLKYFKKSGKNYVRFSIHPNQDNKKGEVIVEAKVLEFRKVKSSNGVTQKRPVILTTFNLMGIEWEAEVTLTSRDEMGFRMLLGRRCMRERFVIDPAKSFLGEKKAKKKKKVVKKKSKKKTIRKKT